MKCTFMAECMCFNAIHAQSHGRGSGWVKRVKTRYKFTQFDISYISDSLFDTQCIAVHACRRYGNWNYENLL